LIEFILDPLVRPTVCGEVAKQLEVGPLGLERQAVLEFFHSALPPEDHVMEERVR
jgi:hypothetical protein